MTPAFAGSSRRCATGWQAYGKTFKRPPWGRWQGTPARASRVAAGGSMAVRSSDEISAILRKQIEGFDQTMQATNVGTVTEVGDGIARIWGLSNVMSSELLEFPGGVMGLALNLEEDTVGAV